MEQKELIETIEKAARERAKTLDLSEMRITELPDEIGELVNLNEFRLGHNQLSTLPEQIGQLANLRILDLLTNRFRRLPEQIRYLTNLELFGFPILSHAS